MMEPTRDTSDDIQRKLDIQRRHMARIRANVLKMRKHLARSEAAASLYDAIKAAYREENPMIDRGTLASRMESNFDAKCAVNDSQLYDRWTMKYAAVIQAEIEAFRANIHPEETE